MGLELELDRDGPSNDERALRLEQERARELSRELELQKDTVSLDRGLEKVDTLSDMSLQCLSETELDFIKREISEFAFIKTGSPANIQELEYDPDRNLVLARCNGRSLQIELDKEGFEKPIEVREKLSELQTLEQKHQQLEKNVGHLEDMVRIAIDQHNKDALMQEIKIEQASQGLMGVWNKLTGQIPAPYPSLYEKPLTHDDLTRSLLIADVKTESFQQLLDDQMSDIRRYPQKIDEHLDRVVEQSREHLEAVKLETAAMVARYELERTVKQPEIEPQLEKPIEERPIVDERQQGSRQADLNPTMSQDEREFTPQLDISQNKIDEMNALYENRLSDINLRLESITKARQSLGYWDQPNYILNSDMSYFNQLTAEKYDIHDVLEKSPQEQLEYLEMHPELQQSNDSLEKSQDQPASFDDLKSRYGIGVQGFTAPEVAENSLSEQIRDAHEIAERHQALRDEYTEKMAILNTDERIDYIKTNPLELSVDQLQDTLDTFSLIQQIELAQQQDLLPEELATSLTLGMGELAVTAPINWSVKMMVNVASMPAVAMDIDYDAIRDDLIQRYSFESSEHLDRLMQPIHEALAPTLQEIYQSSVDQYGEEQAKLMLKGLEGLGDLLMVSVLARAPIEMAVDRQELQKLVQAELNNPDKVVRVAEEMRRQLSLEIIPEKVKLELELTSAQEMRTNILVDLSETMKNRAPIHETNAAAQLESILKVKLEPVPKGALNEKIPDFVISDSRYPSLVGKKVDFMYTAESDPVKNQFLNDNFVGKFNKNTGEYTQSSSKVQRNIKTINDHVNDNKADIVPMDLRNFNEANRNLIKEWVKDLDHKSQSKIIIIE